MKLTTLVANVLSVSEDVLDDSSNANNTANWDSAKHIDLLLAVEVAYNIQFTMSEITSMQNLGDMRVLLEGKGAALAA